MAVRKQWLGISGKIGLCLALILSIYVGAAGNPAHASVQTATGILAAGNNYSLYLDTSGKVWSWGNNSYGQLGRTGESKAPAQISGLTNVTRIAAWANHSMAISDSGNALWGFGYNGYGQLGDGSNQNKSVPAAVAGLPIGAGITVVDVAVGDYHTLALLSDGTVWSWGYNGHGQLGDGTNTNSKTPKQVAGLSGIEKIAAGDNQSFAIDNSGNIWAWGYNGYGQLGDGSTVNRLTPVQLVVEGTTFVRIDSSQAHTLAIDQSGDVWAWGSNYSGQLGTGTSQNSYVPVKVADGPNAFSDISVGDNHSIALDSTGKVYVWGSNSDGRLGDGTLVQSNVPKMLPITGVKAIGAGYNHSLLVTEDNRVWGFGDNSYGQLGRNSTVDRYEPVEAMLTPGSISGTVADIEGAKITVVSDDGEWTVNTAANGAYSVAGLAADEYKVVVEYSGYKADMQIVSVTGLVPDVAGVDFTLTSSADVSVQPSVQAGDRFSVALKADGSLKAWGYDYYGQLGVGGTNRADKLAPVPIELSDAAFIAVGRNNAAAVKKDGTMWMWGYNANGQLGNRTTNHSSVPVQVPGLANVTAVAIGDYHTMALSEGKVWVWGYNGYGQLGDGTTINRTIPKQLAGLTNIVSIAAGNSFSAAVDADGKVYAWGYNGSGQLGDGTTSPSYAPKQVSIDGNPAITAVAAGGSHMFAMSDSNAVYGWGDNSYGTLGIGNTSGSVKTATPISFPGGVTIQSISTNSYHTIAFTTAGEVYSWGFNIEGYLGNNTDVSVTSPAAVSSSLISGVTAVSAGYNHSLAMKSDGTLWSWGTNTNGQLGRDNLVSRIVPVQVKEQAGSAVITTNPGASVSLLSEDGVLTATADDGQANFDNLAQGRYIVMSQLEGYQAEHQFIDVGVNNATLTLPLSPVPDITILKSIKAGDNFTLYLKEDGTVWSYGYNGNGQLGNGSKVNQSVPVQVSGLTDVVSIEAGNYHAAAIRKDGTVWMWGSNYYGQLGDGTRTDHTTPVQVPGLSHIVEISLYDNHSIARSEDGKVWAWGYNYYGQLGDGTTTSRKLPQLISIPGDQSIVSVSTTYGRTVAVGADGKLYGWGYSDNGLLGQVANYQKQLTPVQLIISGIDDAQKIAAAPNHTLVLDEIVVENTFVKRLKGWGNNYYGQLGIGSTVAQTSAVEVNFGSDPTPEIVSFDSSQYHSAAIDTDGNLWTWGYNGSGQIGDNTTSNRLKPYKVSQLANVTEAAVGREITVAATSGNSGNEWMDESPWGWGTNGNYQLGRNNTTTRWQPVQAMMAPGSISVSSLENAQVVLVSPEGVKSMDPVTGQPGKYQLAGLAPDNYTVVVQKNGLSAGSSTVYLASGENEPDLNIALGELSSAPASGVVKAGDYHSVLLEPLTGNVKVWGYNGYGQLGNGNYATLNVPPESAVLTDAMSIDAGANFTVALKRDGTVWTWGNNGSGQLGNGTTTSSNTPVQVIGLTNVIKIAAGSNHVLALKSDNTLWAWGYNYYGALGDGTNTNRSKPIQIMTGVTAISAGQYHSLAVSGGKLYAWGYNYYGQLGDGTTTSTNAPKLVLSDLGGAPVAKVYAGQYHSAALSTAGNLYTWGYNYYGQLGINNTTTFNTPQSVDSAVTEAAAGTNYTLYQKAGALYGMGYNYYGQLGDGSFQTKKIPTAVSAESGLISEDSDIYSFDAGDNHSIAYASGGMYAWGYNYYGQVGDGTIASRNTPVRVGEGAPVIQDLALTAVAGDSFITLQWQPITGAKSYQIIKDTDENSAVVVGSDTLAYTISGLMNGTASTFEIRALAEDLTLILSASVQSTPIKTPGAPTAEVMDRAVILAWQPVEGYDGSISYYIYKDSSLIGETTNTEFLVEGLDNGTAYTFRIAMKDPSGNVSGLSDAVSAVPTAQVSPGPATLTASAFDSEVELSWAKVTDATGYRIYINDQLPITIAPDEADPVKYVVNGLTNDTAYTFTVTAIDAFNAESLPSPAAMATPIAASAAPPTMPADLTVTTSMNSVQLTWQANTEFDLTGYKIYKNDVYIQTVEAPSFTDSELIAGEAYRYSVAAVDSAELESAKAEVEAMPGDGVIVQLSYDSGLQGSAELLANVKIVADYIGEGPDMTDAVAFTNAEGKAIFANLADGSWLIKIDSTEIAGISKTIYSNGEGFQIGTMTMPVIPLKVTSGSEPYSIIDAAKIMPYIQQYDMDGDGANGQASDIEILLQYIRTIYTRETELILGD